MDLFSPIALGDLQLTNRVVMAPLTRLRAGESGVPNDLIVEHYRQRAGLGMIITEGVWPNPQGQGYPGQPGIVTDEQVEGWRKVAEAVHERGGRIVMQLMHAGRVSHPDVNGGREVEAPSAIAIEGQVRTPAGKKPYPVPHALTTEELARVRDEFVQAARNAVAAGLDGVELHGANGYLLHEFLSPASNERTDSYGGSPENRARFVVEVATAVAEAIGAGRVGLRISPQHDVQGVIEPDDADVQLTYGSLLDQLRPLGLAYLSVLHKEPGCDMVQELRKRFGGPLVANTGFSSPTSREDAVSLVEEAHAEAVAVGRPVIANPDLVERWAGEHPENEPQPH
ncbi:MAG: alkene reductase, partial [Blastococcus sp.]|nr:alkene reductase [Blastococcus sp.]